MRRTVMVARTSTEPDDRHHPRPPFARKLWRIGQSMGKQRGQSRGGRTVQRKTAGERVEVRRGRGEGTTRKGWGMALRRPHPQALCASQTPGDHPRSLIVFARCAARSACSVASCTHPRRLRCPRTTPGAPSCPRTRNPDIHIWNRFLRAPHSTSRTEHVATVSTSGPPRRWPRRGLPSSTSKSPPYRQRPWAHRVHAGQRPLRVRATRRREPVPTVRTSSRPSRPI